MRFPLRAYLELIRPPNVFTAAADIIAGFLYAGGSRNEWPLAAILMVASMCLYAGGVALNDVCDAGRDAAQRPGRPIPSGRVSRRGAVIFSLLLLVCGICLSWAVSGPAAMLACGLVGAIVIYDAVLKATPLAPGIMGLCRALNLLLGMSVTGPLDWPKALPPAALTWLYITSVTFFARREASVSGAWRLRLGTIGVATAVGGLVGLPWLTDETHLGFLFVVAGLLSWVCHLGQTAMASRSPADVQRAVQWFVLSLVVFDACIAAAARGIPIASIVMAPMVPAASLRRYFRIT